MRAGCSKGCRTAAAAAVLPLVVGFDAVRARTGPGAPSQARPALPRTELPGRDVHEAHALAPPRALLTPERTCALPTRSRTTTPSRLFNGVRAPSTLGTFLRSFTFGHVRQLDAVGSRLRINLCGLLRISRRTRRWTAAQPRKGRQAWEMSARS